jgi:hypothetical protein
VETVFILDEDSIITLARGKRETLNLSNERHQIIVVVEGLVDNLVSLSDFHFSFPFLSFSFDA